MHQIIPLRLGNTELLLVTLLFIRNIYPNITHRPKCISKFSIYIFIKFIN